MHSITEQIITHLGRSQTSFETIHDLIWDFYISADPVPNEELHRIHHQIIDALGALSFPETDGVLCLISQLACEYERAALREGVRIGAAIMFELSHS